MASTESSKKVAHIAVIGLGWWSQGWHLPHLQRNPKAKIAAMVDTSDHPKSNLNPNLEPLSVLKDKYQCPTFSSIEQLFETNPDLAATLDGVIVCTSHATHSDIGTYLLLQQQDTKRSKPLHLLTEKPMTTNVDQAKHLHETVQKATTTTTKGGGGGGGGGSKNHTSSFLINHSANYIPQTRKARELVQSGAIGTIQHITAFFASPLSWIFEDPSNTGWNEPTPDLMMLGNGFAWGQQSHLLAWIYHVTDLTPTRVYCTMQHSTKTGADVAHAASIKCEEGGGGGGGVTLSVSGTSLLPGNAHSDPPVAKIINIQIYGTNGALMYSGNDQDPASGRLEIRVGGDENARDKEGSVEVHCPEFRFEELEQDGIGPLSLQSFIAACLGEEDYYVGADSLVGLKSIQTLDAMYRSEASGNAEAVA